MNDETIERLLALNRRFYASFAEHFAASRSISDPALTSILPYLPSDATILDVGCGNGRLALLLDRERPGSTYVGVDAIPELIEEACAQAGQLPQTDTTFRVADVTRPDWTEDLPQAPFDCVVVLAVLHHIPDFDLRARLLRAVAGVLKPQGYAILSTWRFLAHERMRRKIVDWDEVGVDEGELEPGDFLLDWKRGGRGLRYCHMVDEEEVERLVAASGFVVRETFRAGGREGDLSLFAVLDRREEARASS
jgi:SAM-dependent methyltransferase